MEFEKNEKQSVTQAPEKAFFYTQTGLRLLTIVFALCSIFITISSNQNYYMYGLIMPVTYKYSSAFRFYVGADSVVSALMFCSLVYEVVSYYKAFNFKDHELYRHLYDMVNTLLMISGIAAATAVGYIGKYGQEQSGWFAVCGRVPKYCHQMIIGLVFAYLSLLCLLCLTFTCAYKIHSRSRQ